MLRGGQNSDGKFYNVGDCGKFAIGHVNGLGDVPYIFFRDDGAGFSSGSEEYARPQLSN